jgi:DNA modification methylase
MNGTTYRLLHGDALEMLRTLPDNSVDSIVTDPPAGIGFMGKGWDKDKGGAFQWIGWLCEIMQEALRVIKPGGHALVWALPRTSHWTGMALEMAGWEIRDKLVHVFGSGFPKSLDVGKAIDKAAEVEREVVGTSSRSQVASEGWDRPWKHRQMESSGTTVAEYNITAPATPDAKKYDGWGTALKPATEDWWLARKPLSSTVAGTVLEWGTGALNVDRCRVGTSKSVPASPRKGSHGGVDGEVYGKFGKPPTSTDGWDPNTGRYPPHLLLTHSATCTETECAPDCPVLELGRQSGESISSGGLTQSFAKNRNVYSAPGVDKLRQNAGGLGDTGTAARFFPTFHYFPKPSTREKSAGIPRAAHKSAGAVTGRKDGSKGLSSPRAGAGRTSGARNTHPTVKGLDLIRWLWKLITPEGGTGLDLFMGSGTHGAAALMEEFNYIGIEREAEYVELSRFRIRYWAPMWAREIAKK